jgi:hypothetical protein
VGEPQNSPITGQARKAARAAVVGVVLTGAVLAGRAMGALDGWAALGLAGVVMLAIPTSRSLSRRALLAGCFFFGWGPLLWWVHPAVGSLGRVTVVTAASVGLLGAWVAAAADPKSRLRQLVPRPRPIDMLPPLAALGATVVLWPWLTVRDAASSLTLLLEGWDNSAHFNFVEGIRSQGGVLWTLTTAPDGTPRAPTNYPQGFHSSAATLIELMSSPAVGTPGDEVVWYMIATAVITVAMVWLLAAGICALPWLRSRPMLALPAVSIVFGVIVLGPGAASLRSGFTNFTLACTMTAACWLVTLPMPRVAMPLQVAAVTGAVASVANSWTALLVVAIPAAASLALPLRRTRWRASRRRWASAAVLVAACAAVTIVPLLRLRSVDVAGLPAMTGAIVHPGFESTISLALVATVLCLAAHRRHQGGRASAGPGDGVSTRLVYLAVLPPIGLAVMSIIAAENLAAGSSLNYYFWKAATAVEVVSLLLLATAAVTLVARTSPSLSPGGRRLVSTSSIVMSLAILVACGQLGPGHAWSVPGTRLMANDRAALANPSAQAADLLAGAAVQFERPSSTVVYLAIGSEPDLSVLLAEAWYRSLTRTWTQATASESTGDHHLDSTQDAAGAAVTILAANPRALVLVRPDVLSDVRSDVTPASLRTRVLTWP